MLHDYLAIILGHSSMLWVQDNKKTKFPNNYALFFLNVESAIKYFLPRAPPSARGKVTDFCTKKTLFRKILQKIFLFYLT